MWKNEPGKLQTRHLSEFAQRARKENVKPLSSYNLPQIKVFFQHFSVQIVKIPVYTKLHRIFLYEYQNEAFETCFSQIIPAVCNNIPNLVVFLYEY